MATMRAVVADGKGKAEVVSGRPLPKIRPKYVRIKVKAIALNPTDWKHVEFAKLPAGYLFGCDYAGVVDEVGSGYTKDWKVGDRIFGMVNGGNELQQEDGAFAEYIVAPADVQMRVPDNMSFEDAVTLGLAAVTCGQGLFSLWGLDLKWPDSPISAHEPLFIYGGSTGMGSFGIQLAKLAGYHVITVCSPRNFELVKSFGADEVFDYKDPDVVAKIGKAANNNLKYVWDTISEGSSVSIASEAISSGGIYGNVLGLTLDRDDIKSTATVAYFSTGEPIKKGFFGLQKDDTTEDFNFAVKWNALVEKLLAEGKLKPHPPKVSKGLDGVIGGLDDMRSGKISGQKLVYTL